MRAAALIELREASVDFAVYNAVNRSLKNRIVFPPTGGVMGQDKDGLISVRSLDRISLEIHAGERVGLLGHNGAGKTTLLRVLSGIYLPTEGEALIRGKCTSLINISLGIDHEATGRENIFLRSALMGLSSSQVRERQEEIIAFSGLGEFIDMPFRTYSSGMQLRLAFSVSTCIRPQILIMDEWLSTGDQDFKERAQQRIEEVLAATQVLVLASHSMELLAKNCNRIIWLDHGKVRMDGAVEDVVKAYLNTVPEGGNILPTG
jgi:lipopolysaccharide transport system ATP-binding protein